MTLSGPKEFHSVRHNRSLALKVVNEKITTWVGHTSAAPVTRGAVERSPNVAPAHLVLRRVTPRAVAREETAPREGVAPQVQVLQALRQGREVRTA